MILEIWNYGTRSYICYDDFMDSDSAFYYFTNIEIGTLGPLGTQT